MADHHRLTLNELRQDLASAELAREQIELRCTRIQAAIELLEEKIQATAEEKPRPAEPESKAEPGVLATMSMPEAIQHCLSTSSRPLSKRELMARLREGGKPEGNHFGQHVYNTLYRLSKDGGPVRQEENGRWSLVGRDNDSTPSDSFLLIGKPKSRARVVVR